MTKLSSSVAVLAASALVLQPALGYAQTANAISDTDTMAVIAPRSSANVSANIVSPEKEVKLTHAQKLALLQKNIKYVFVLFQENRSFDFYFGTYPGAHGLYSQPASQTPGFTQPFVTTTGQVTTIQPFLIPPAAVAATGKTVQLYPSDTDSVNHSHTAYETKIDFTGGTTKNDGYALTEEGITLTNGIPSKVPTLQQEQMGELVMSHVDCNTVPVLWNYADRGVLFDDFHQTVLSASSPNAIAMIAGQSGETQWVKHPEDSTKAFGSISGNGVPVVSDGDPFWGSQLDIYGSGQPAMAPSSNPQINLTFATLPLSFMGAQIQSTVQSDKQPQTDLTDIEKDIKEIAGEGVQPTNWGWYQQGYAGEPVADYITHHNGPQYFGYVSNNPAVSQHLHGLNQFFTDVQAGSLAPNGGVYYVRGGYNNIQGLNPVDPNPTLETVFNGDDDHPGYSDAQISSALVAKEVNAIASSPYWSQSAIIISYDETDGLYDHAPEIIRDYDPYGEPLDQGPRIPTIVLSPYGVVHGISHEATEHSSIIKFINQLYGLTPLADLPDEKQAKKQGMTTLNQAFLGPADDNVSGVGNMFSAFDNNRLSGTVAVLPASYVEIPTSFYSTLPQLNNNGCQYLNIEPTDHGLPNPIPTDFNPRPSSEPGEPLITGTP